MNTELNPLIDKYLIDGCMRCKYGATPKCKVNNWIEELKVLRQIVLETGLKEELKWGVPVYTKNGKNIVTISALKASACLGFFKGVLLSDSRKILYKQGNIQSDRIVRFTNVEDIIALRDDLISYIEEAIEIGESGKKVELKKNSEPIPDELLQAFEHDQALKIAFYSLTPGRQRGYIIHFSQPKQSQTRNERIEKYRQQILSGFGLYDKYSR
jgi:uncharacterized protein YdeI (YjbR/CyaY-like superfamily)